RSPGEPNSRLPDYPLETVEDGRLSSGHRLIVGRGAIVADRVEIPVEQHKALARARFVGVAIQSERGRYGKVWSGPPLILPVEAHAVVVDLFIGSLRKLLHRSTTTAWAKSVILPILR